MRVYVAGPMGKGPMEHNIRQALDAGNKLMHQGCNPFIPHLYWFMSLSHPHDYERWMSLDIAFLLTCEAVLRLPGESPGADRECKLCQETGIPVFYDIESLVQYRDEIKSKVRELAPVVQGVEPSEIGSSRELPSLGRTVYAGERSQAASEDTKEDIGRLGS